MAIIVKESMHNEAAFILKTIKEVGFDAATVSLEHGRKFVMETQDGAIKFLKETNSKSADLNLFKDGRNGTFVTRDFRPDKLKNFLIKAREMLVLTDADPAATLPPDNRLSPLPDIDLDLIDRELVNSKKNAALEICRQIEAGARKVAPEAITVEASFEDGHYATELVNSKGFCGFKENTVAMVIAKVNIKDKNGKKQLGADYDFVTHFSDIRDFTELGASAAQRGLDMVGAAPIATGDYPIIVDARDTHMLLSEMLMRPLAGGQIYRKLSFLQDKIGKKIAPDFLTIRDDPFIKRGTGSEPFDAEGMINRPMPVIEKGVLKNYYFNTYWANKMGCEPTTGSPTNWIFDLGSRSGKEMAEKAEKAIYITDFNGGNSNPLTGDFSKGITGFLYENGRLVQPIANMNLACNLGQMLLDLEEVGNDPFKCSSIKCPSLRFKTMKVAGK